MIDRSRFGLNRIMCPTLDMEEFFQLTNELGLNWVELRNDINGGKIIDFYSIQEIRNLAKQYNIQICSINALQRFNNLQEIDKIKEDMDLSNVEIEFNIILREDPIKSESGKVPLRIYNI